MKNVTFATIAFITIFAASLNASEKRESFELIQMLKETAVTCSDLKAEKIGKLFWVKPAMDGWGLILISKTNEKDKYLLSLLASGHEHVLETREIKCQ